MKSYNGFTAIQRNRAGAWLRAQWTSGKLARPSVCCACGQDQGTIDAHAEDYSQPFRVGVTDQYHLCFNCHMMVHCRFNNPFPWERYKGAVAAGLQFAPVFGRNFPAFSEKFLAPMNSPLYAAAWRQAVRRLPPCHSNLIGRHDS